MREYIDFPIIERIVSYMTKQQTSRPWKRGYVTAFYTNGLITSEELEIVMNWINGKLI